MAKKKLDLTEYEGRWVLVGFLPDLVADFRFFVRDGYLMKLIPEVIQMPDQNIFERMGLLLGESITVIKILNPTPAEEALARVEFGEPLRSSKPPSPEKAIGCSAIEIRLVRPRKYKDVLILRASGLLVPHEDFYSGNRFLLNLQRAFKSNRKVFLLNMARVKFLDAIAESVLVQFYGECQAKGIKIVLCGLPPQVREKLETAKLISFFPIFKTEKEALAAN